MPIITVKEKNTAVEFPDGTPPDVMENAIRTTFFTPEEQRAMTTFANREGYRLRKGQSIVDVGGAYWRAMEGTISDQEAILFEQKNTKEFTPENDIRFGANNIAEKIIGGTTELLPYMFSSTLQSINYGNQFGAAAAAAAVVAGQLGPQVAFPEEAFTVAPAFIAGQSVGQAWGAWMNASKVEGGSIYGALINAGVDRDIAKKWAVPAGYMIGAIELLQLGQVFNKFAPRLGKKSITDFIVKKAVAGVKNKAINKFLANSLTFSAKLATFTALEILEEDTQELIALFAEAGGNLQDAMVEDKAFTGPTLKEAGQRIKDTTIQGLLSFPLLGIPGSAVSTISGTRSQNKAQTKKGQESLNNEIKELVEESKKFDNVDDFINENKAEIDKKQVNDLGFDNEELMMEAAFEKGVIEEAPAVEGEVALTEEAKKFDTAEEFVESQDIRVEIIEEGKTAKITGSNLWVSITKSAKQKGKFQVTTFDNNNVPQGDFQANTFEEALRRGRDEAGIIGGAELEAGLREGFLKEEELSDVERSFLARRKQLIDIFNKAKGIEKAKVPTVKEKVSPEEKIVNLQKAIQKARDKFVTEPAQTKAEIKETQTQLIKSLEESPLEAKDKAKFIRTIKNIQTQEQLLKALPDIRKTIARLNVAAQKRKVSLKIKKELKTTKPLKVGQRRVGKFDFETNKLFDTLRDFNKLNQEKAQAEFDKFPEEGLSEVDLIKKRFLSLKANGASASVEIHNQVLADILRIKELGKKAKDEADLEKRLNRQEIVNSALDSIDKIKADKRTVKTKIGNIYRKGFTSIYSMLNSIGGKDFAETHDPELNESRRITATYKATLDITVEASKIYNDKNIMRVFEKMSLKDYQITDVKDGLTTELSKLELIDIYNSLKNDKKKQDYFKAFGQDQVESLMAKLTREDELFGDSLQEAVQGYREILNKRNIEITGRDLGFVENYWPATSEFQVSVLDDLRVQGETPSALKERAKTRVIPVPKNAWYKAQRHIAQAEHVDNVSRKFEELKRLFIDRKVKDAIEKKFGEDVYKTLIIQIDNISLNKQTEKIDAISGLFQKAINNWVTAKIALNPSTFVRQLMSMGNFAENMNASEWVDGFIKGVLSPKETFTFVWNNAPFLEARFNKGFSEALREAIEGAESISVNKANWTRMLTSLVRAGDITAIIYGGFPLIKSELAKGKSMKEAIDVFEKATLKAQQSGLSSSLSQFQNSKNPFARLFLAFKNTSNQYFRKMVDSVITFQNGDISVGQFAKTMSIYAVVQPILYVSAGFATKLAFSFLGKIIGLNREDEDFEEQLEKLVDDIMIQLIVSPVNAMPIIDDAIRTGARVLTGQKVFKVFSTPLFDDLEKGIRALTKKEITGEDYLKTATSILEPTTAIPIGTGIRFFEILTGKKISGKKRRGKAPGGF